MPWQALSRPKPPRTLTTLIHDKEVSMLTVQQTVRLQIENAGGTTLARFRCDEPGSGDSRIINLGCRIGATESPGRLFGDGNGNVTDPVEVFLRQRGSITGQNDRPDRRPLLSGPYRRCDAVDLGKRTTARNGEQATTNHRQVSINRDMHIL